MNSNVVVVVVTYNRKELLGICLNAVLRQTRPADAVVVINNASTDGTREMLEEQYADKVFRIHMESNVGGAGGFFRGMKWAFDRGADWMWLMDDDGIPEPDALEQLLKPEVISKYDILNSLVVAPEDRNTMCCEIPVNNRMVDQVSELTPVLTPDGVIEGQTLLFNGTLISRRTIETVGYVKPDLFIWGDVDDFNFRVEQAKLRCGTLVSAVHVHPKSKIKSVSFAGMGQLLVVPPHRLSITARNLGYLASPKVGDRGWMYLILKPITYFLFYVSRGDLSSAWTFVKYWFDGALDRYALKPSRQTLLAMVDCYTLLPKR